MHIYEPVIEKIHMLSLSQITQVTFYLSIVFFSGKSKANITSREEMAMRVHAAEERCEEGWKDVSYRYAPAS